MITGAYAMLMEEIRTPGMSVQEQIARVDEILMPQQESRAAQNRRAFAGLIEGARGLGVRKRS